MAVGTPSVPCDGTFNVAFTFGGVSYTIPSDLFNAGYTDTSGSTCLGAVFEMTSSSSLSWIVGE